MGCDVHAFIDYDDFKTREGDWYVSNFASHVDIGRNYTLFALMAGVRYDENRMGGKLPMFEPRGIPNKVSWSVKDEYTLWVIDDDEEDSERSAKRSQALKWIAQGISEMFDEHYITHPDWHSASWLTADELDQVNTAYAEIESAEMAWYQSPDQPIGEEARITGKKDRYGWIHVEAGEVTKNSRHKNLDAIIAAMRVIDGDTPGRSRLVFWFDN